MTVTTKRYKCLSCEPPNCEYESVCYDAIQCWKSKAKDSEGFESVSRGCTTNPQQLQYCGPAKLMTFPHTRQSTLQSHHTGGGQYAIDCCSGEFCNNGSFPLLPVVYKEKSGLEEQYADIAKIILAVVAIMFVLCAVTMFFVLFMKRRYRKRILDASSISFDSPSYRADAVLHAMLLVGDGPMKEYTDQSVTSGSGFGRPLLMQQSVGKQISLEELVGRGKYGEVWRGLFQGDSVAVKIFLSKDEASWSRETEVYSVLTWSPYILHYIGSDITSRNSCTQFWLVTHYHPYGSLYDYLNKEVITHREMLKLFDSVMRGVEHLHSEEMSSESMKIAVAHRDLKSKNILVKLDGECCIADFGLAVTKAPQSGEMVIPPNPRVGTKRYMAPEVLNETINMHSFEALRQADVYSVGLVLWELCWRTESKYIVEEYKPPFFDCVGADPSFEEMRKVVDIDKRRPVLPNQWATDSVMNETMKLMKECWHQSASVRPTALRILKTIKKIKQHHLSEYSLPEKVHTNSMLQTVNV